MAFYCNQSKTLAPAYSGAEPVPLGRLWEHGIQKVPGECSQDHACGER